MAKKCMEKLFIEDMKMRKAHQKSFYIKLILERTAEGTKILSILYHNFFKISESPWYSCSDSGLTCTCAISTLIPVSQHCKTHVCPSPKVIKVNIHFVFLSSTLLASLSFYSLYFLLFYNNT